MCDNVVIRAAGLVPRYGTRLVTKPLNFSLHSGQLGILTGANGCGKTTVLRTILGEVEYNGSLEVFQAAPAQGRPWAMARKGIRLIPQFPVIAQFLTIEEFGRATSLGQATIASSLSDIEQLAGTSRSKLMGQLSFGQRRLIEIIFTLSLRSGVILADEPLAGIAPTAAKRVYEMFVEFLKIGGAILISAHSPELSAWSVDSVFEVLADEAPA